MRVWLVRVALSCCVILAAGRQLCRYSSRARCRTLRVGPCSQSERKTHGARTRAALTRFDREFESRAH